LELLEAAVKAAALLRAQKEGENDHAGEKGRGQKGEGRRQKAEGRRQKAEGRRQKGEGRREKAEGRREKGKGRREKNGKRSPFSLLPFLLSATLFRNC
jgi:hypothetical protein